MLVSLALVGAILAALAPGKADSIKWRIDTVHSEVSFRIRHLVTKVPGSFTSWGGTILADPHKLAEGSVEVTFQTASISTRNERRDADLRSDRLFAADSFPQVTFKSTTVEVTGSELTVTGDLTIRGVTKQVVLTGEYGGTVGTPEPGKQRIGFTASTKINRLDYGVKWNRALEGGGMLLGDEVEITINVEAVRT